MVMIRAALAVMEPDGALVLMVMVVMVLALVTEVIVATKMMDCNMGNIQRVTKGLGTCARDLQHNHKERTWNYQISKCNIMGVRGCWIKV